MAFLRVWASSAALKPELALTVPPLAAWVHKKDRKMWPKGAYTHSMVASRATNVFWAPTRSLNTCPWQDTAVTGRMMLLFPCGWCSEVQPEVDSKEANKLIFHQAARGERATAEEVVRLPEGSIAQAEVWVTGSSPKLCRDLGKCCRQVQQLRQWPWGWSQATGRSGTEAEWDSSWRASWGGVSDTITFSNLVSQKVGNQTRSNQASWVKHQFMIKKRRRERNNAEKPTQQGCQ